VSLLAAPLELLFEADGLPAFDLPPELVEAYGGPLGFAPRRLIANFVETLDGVTAIPSRAQSHKLVAAGSEADRFVLGLLRAVADVLVIGSGTLGGSPGSVWSPAQAFPAAAESFAEARRRLGRPPELPVAVLTGSGLIDPDHPAFAGGAFVLTTDGGAEALTAALPEGSSVVSIGPGPELDLEIAVEHLAGLGHRLILSEGGPSILGGLLAAGLVDELFVTVSPILAGRTVHGDRLSLVEHADLLPGGAPRGTLLGARREGDHLFLRYALEG
jgi:riboflavin biosynthesis pyrimidine reductase